MRFLTIFFIAVLAFNFQSWSQSYDSYSVKKLKYWMNSATPALTSIYEIEGVIKQAKLIHNRYLDQIMDEDTAISELKALQSRLEFTSEMATMNVDMLPPPPEQSTLEIPEMYQDLSKAVNRGRTLGHRAIIAYASSVRGDFGGLRDAKKIEVERLEYYRDIHDASLFVTRLQLEGQKHPHIHLMDAIIAMYNVHIFFEKYILAHSESTDFEKAQVRSQFEKAISEYRLQIDQGLRVNATIIAELEELKAQDANLFDLDHQVKSFKKYVLIFENERRILFSFEDQLTKMINGTFDDAELKEMHAQIFEGVEARANFLQYFSYYVKQ